MALILESLGVLHHNEHHNVNSYKETERQSSSDESLYSRREETSEFQATKMTYTQYNITFGRSLCHASLEMLPI